MDEDDFIGVDESTLWAYKDAFLGDDAPDGVGGSIYVVSFAGFR